MTVVDGPTGQPRRNADGSLADVGYAETYFSRELTPEGIDRLLQASTADVQRQCDELRQLVREAIYFAAILSQGEDHCSVCKRAEDWLRRARSAAK